MPRTWTFFLLSLWAGAGCFGWPLETRTRHDLGKQPAPLPANAPPVTAEQITSQNAHIMAESEWDAMDREAQKEMLPPEKANPKKR